MTLPRIIRPRQAPPDPCDYAPPPAWTKKFRGDLSDLLVSHSFRPKLVESVVTLARLCLSLEAELAIDPSVHGEPAGDVQARFYGPHGSVLVAAKGRAVVLSGWDGIPAAPRAFHARDARGEVVGEPPACLRQRLRLGIAWTNGDVGVPEWQMYQDAACGRKLI